MKQEELKKVLAEVDPLLANAVDSMISFIHAEGIDGVPSERQIEQVNTYFDSIVSRTGKDYEKWSEYRWDSIIQYRNRSHSMPGTPRTGLSAQSP